MRLALHLRSLPWRAMFSRHSGYADMCQVIWRAGAEGGFLALDQAFLVYFQTAAGGKFHKT